MKRLHRNRGGGAQGHDGAEPDLVLLVRRNNHNRPLYSMSHFAQVSSFRAVAQFVAASEAAADLGFMARMLAVCSLPRIKRGDQLQYVWRKGPLTLAMTAGVNNKLPYGNLPRLLLACVCTEAVRTQNRRIY